MGQSKKPDDNGLARFAAALREHMAVLNMTGAELARRTGRSPSAITNYTIGRDTPPPDVVFAIEAALRLAAGTLARHLGFGPIDPAGQPPGVAEAVLADRFLTPQDKTLLIALYESLTRPDR